MAYLFPRVAFNPVRCAPPSHSFAPLFSLFDDAARELQHYQRATRSTRRPFNPRFDVQEDKDSYVLEGEVPGFKEADLSIEWNNDTLAIRGRHETVKESGNRPDAVAAIQAPAEATTPSEPETDSVKSYHATVEDEEPTASGSAVTTNPSTQEVVRTEPTVTKSVDKQPEVQSWIRERSSGEFLRQFSFPANAVNHEAIRASLESGILKIVVPKAAQQPSRRINIE